MQNRYTGDIGDFAKYALLKALVGENLRLGVVWYLNPGEEDNRDGSLVNYHHLRHCDPQLHDALAEMRRQGRSVHAVADAGLLPSDTVYYSEPICSNEDGKRSLRTMRASNRTIWHSTAMEAVSQADLVFVDPDNGIAGDKVCTSDLHAVKYVFLEEIADYMRRGQSLVVYHHQTREKGGIKAQVDRRIRSLVETTGALRAWALIFRRQSVRAFIIACSAIHAERLHHRSIAFSKTVWCMDEHFELYAPTCGYAMRDCD